MIVYIQQIRVAGWIRVVLSWLLLYMGRNVNDPFHNSKGCGNSCKLWAVESVLEKLEKIFHDERVAKRVFSLISAMMPTGSPCSPKYPSNPPPLTVHSLSTHRPT